jgi:hypothetical protein
VRLRAVNQLKVVEGKFEEFEDVVRRNDAEGLLGTLFVIIKYSFGVPSAVLNRPVTNCRGYLFCKRDSDELGFFDYPGLVLGILGSSGFGADTVKGLLDSAYGLFDSSGLPSRERETYKRHLEIADYMVEIGEPAGAAWPVFFWAVGAWNEVKRDGLNAVARNIYESLGPIRDELKLVEWRDIRRRVRLIEHVIELGKQII